MGVSKTIKNDYGPDCSSTPEDVAETNELEGLRSALEDITKVINRYPDYKGRYPFYDEIKEILRPFC